MRILHGAAFALAAAIVAGPPVVLVADAVRPAATIPSWATGGGGDSSMSTPHTLGAIGAQPLRLIVPYLVLTASQSLSDAQVAAISALPGVRAALAVDGGQVLVNGHRGTVIGIPDGFRSWTPPQTATADGIWSALSGGSLVVNYDAANRLGLTLGGSYLVGGAVTTSVPFTAIAPSGIPGADAIVNAQLSGELGLPHNVAVLISAPGAAYGPLVQRLLAVAGGHAQVIDLVPVQSSAASAAASHALPVAAATPGLPTSWLQLYRDAAALYCPGLSWTVLAAIGQIESGDGTNDGPSSAGALGPMQFMPSTWAQYGITGFGRTGPPDIMDPLDAVPSAARMLCEDGATSGSAGLSGAIFDYNHADWYVTEVLQLAEEYAHDYP